MTGPDSQSAARVVAEVAEIAAETIELGEVFNRVASAVGRLVAFDRMGVVRFLDGGRAVVHATTGTCRGDDVSCSEPFPLDRWSPRLRPRPGAIPRVDDAREELDPSFPADAELLRREVRSILWEPLGSSGTAAGGLWLSSSEPRAFTSEHQEQLRPIAALLGVAVEHWRIWDAERRRSQRLDQLEALVAPLAESLDVREVFGRISDAIRPILPHDLLVLTEIEGDGRTVRIAALAAAEGVPTPDGPIRLTVEETGLRQLDHEVSGDVTTELEPTTERSRVLLATGLRSWLRVPVRVWGEIQGSVGFMHREANRYGAEDVEVARRLADRIAVALSHHRLAEEARVAAEARERAARLEATVETLSRELETLGRVRVTGESAAWKQVLMQVARVASSDTTVLVTGESGTGKEVVSNLVHRGSLRRDRPFVAINCAALPEQLLESELFGHERGAFTGAFAAKIGRLEMAAGGTLFLDEVGELSPLVQAKLLRLLQEREFQRLGGTRTLHADVRVIAATNRDLPTAIARGQFREDLYWRLHVFEIHLPPLRERPEDVLLLARAFVAELGRTMGRPAAGISRDAREWLLAYPWPGNVRELRNAIERAILLCDGGLITREHLPARVAPADRPRPALQPAPLDEAAPLPPGGVDLAQLDRSFVERALRQTQGNKSKAARLLGLSRSQFYSRLEKYRLL